MLCLGEERVNSQPSALSSAPLTENESMLVDAVRTAMPIRVGNPKMPATSVKSFDTGFSHCTQTLMCLFFKSMNRALQISAEK